MTDLSKSTLSDSIAETHDLSKTAAKAIVADVFDQIVQAVRDGNKARINGFGTFEPQFRSERTARNPINGESVKVPAKTVLKFKAVPALKDL